MEVARTLLIAGMLGTGAIALGTGCEVEPEHGHVRHAPVEVSAPVEVGPPPVAYVYEPGYYDRGYWRGDYWYWHSHDGRLYREAREDHERREHDWHEHEHYDHH